MDSSHNLFTVTVLMHVHVETETVPLIAYTHQTVLQTFYTLNCKLIILLCFAHANSITVLLDLCTTQVSLNVVLRMSM